MTNFEKWRDSLTPETFVFGRYAHFIDRACANCPATNVCPKGGENMTCAEEFLRWANAPAKEES